MMASIAEARMPASLASLNRSEAAICDWCRSSATCGSLVFIFFEDLSIFSLFKQKYNSPFLGHARHLFHLDAKNDGPYHAFDQPRFDRRHVRQPAVKFGQN